MRDPNAFGGSLSELGAVGHAARASKKDSAQPTDLVSFSVKKGDNGGVLVCENYEKKTPAGRRAGSFLGGMDYKENPFSPDDGAAATSHIQGLLGQMGVRGAEPEPPAAVAMRGPNAAGVAMRGPSDADADDLGY